LLAPDPVFQLVNQYAYANGNPVWFWDPDGASAQLAIGITMGVALFTASAGAVSGNVPVTLFSVAVIVGLVVPPSRTGAAAPATLATLSRFGPNVLPVQAVLYGFSAGQALQGAFASDFGGLTDPFGDRPRAPTPHPDPYPPQRKEVDVQPEARLTGGVGVGGPGTPGGCSPAALASVPGAEARRLLALLVPLEILLGLALVGSRRRR
jgi:hypothetical protein